MDTRILTLAFDEALRLLPRVAGEKGLPSDFRQLASKILLVLLEPNQMHEQGEAMSGYDEEGHRIFIAYYCAVGEVPHPSFAILALVHEMAHIFLEMDEEEAELLTIRAGKELGLDVSGPAGQRKEVYAETKRVWNEGLFPYLGVLRGEVGPEEAKAKIREMADRGFNFSV